MKYYLKSVFPDLDNCLGTLTAADRKAYNDALDEAAEELENFQC